MWMLLPSCSISEFRIFTGGRRRKPAPVRYDNTAGPAVTSPAVRFHGPFNAE